LDVEDLETMDEQDELVAMFERELQSVARAWREQGIDTFGIVSGSTPPVLQVVWWINKLDSRARFDEVMQQLGREWTVEALVLKDRFRPLFVDWRGVLHKAKGRLSGEVTD
jgi:hypothetical protein